MPSLKKYLQIILLFFYIFSLSGCDTSSVPDISYSPINFIKQISNVAFADSHKYAFQENHQVDLNLLDKTFLEDNEGTRYWFNYKKINPLNNGIIEMMFRFPIPHEFEKNEKKQTRIENHSEKNGFVGIGFKTKNNNDVFAVLFHKSGKLTFGKLGDQPLTIRNSHTERTYDKAHKLKMSFLKGHIIIFFDEEPTLKLKWSAIKDIETIAIMAKAYGSSEKEKVVIVESSFKYRHLKTEPEKNLTDIFRYLEQENVLKNYSYEKEGSMNVFNILPEFLREKNREKLLLGDFTIDSDTRRSIFAPAPTMIKYSVTIPPNSYLNFGYAILSSGWEKSDGMIFSIFFEDKNADRKILFSNFLNPKKEENRRWLENRVDLTSLAGLSGQLIFETLPFDETLSGEIKEDALFDFGVWGDPAIYQLRDSDEQNVILISLDTLRADHVGAYGYFRDTTPNIDALANGGTVFKNAITQAPWTLPSHMSMFTSLYPSELGYSIMNKINKRTKIPEKATTLSEILKENGYLTAGFTGGANVSKVFGFNQGFSFYNERWGLEIDAAFKNMSAWIQNHHKDKFFLFFHTYEIHDYPPGKHEIFTEGINPLDEINYNKALYDGKIKYVDHYVGLLIKKLSNLNLLDKTLIVITSDHGTEFFEHGEGGHGSQLYDEVLLVPLIFHLKGIVPKKTVINNQARVIDVMPTILDILNISTPKNIEGTSLVPFFKNRSDSHLVAFTEGTKYDGKLKVIEPLSIRMLKYKYIYYPQLGDDVLAYLKSKEKETGHSVDMYNQGEGELYNLIEDSGELNNIINLKSSIANDLRKEIRSFIKNSLKKDITKGNTRESVKIDKVTMDRLRSLGYVQ